MPFDFLTRKKDPAADSAGGASGSGSGASRSHGYGIPFDGLTEEWRIVGVMEVKGRLSDVLNKREPVTIDDVRWAPLDGTTELAPAPGLKAVDPYDLIIVMAGEETLPPLSDNERAAHKVHKIAYDVALEVPPYRVIGTVHLHPGDTPDRLLDQSGEMFVPLTGAVAYLDGKPVADLGVEVVLVNRLYIRGVEPTGR